MNYLDQYLIPVSGIKPGNYSFDYRIDRSFFKEFEYSEIKEGDVQVHLVMEKEERLIHLRFSLSGYVKVPCDRCFEVMDQPVSGEEDLIVKFGADFHEESDIVQIIPEGENQFNIAPFIYEYIHLLIPVRRVHPEDDQGNSACDPEVISRLEAAQKSHEPDPRWEILNKLKTKN